MGEEVGKMVVFGLRLEWSAVMAVSFTNSGEG